MPITPARFHPSALKFIAEGKKHFDRILIGTGPVLGSIEAGLACAASDSVVLVAHATQNRILVEKSVDHLNSIGAKLRGLALRSRSSAAAAEGFCR